MWIFDEHAIFWDFSTLNELRNFLRCPLGIIWVSRTSSVPRGMQRTSNRIRTTHQSFFIPIFLTPPPTTCWIRTPVLYLLPLKSNSLMSRDY